MNIEQSGLNDAEIALLREFSEMQDTEPIPSQLEIPLEQNRDTIENIPPSPIIMVDEVSMMLFNERLEDRVTELSSLPLVNIDLEEVSEETNTDNNITSEEWLMQPVILTAEQNSNVVVETIPVIIEEISNSEDGEEEFKNMIIQAVEACGITQYHLIKSGEHGNNDFHYFRDHILKMRFDEITVTNSRGDKQLIEGLWVAIGFDLKRRVLSSSMMTGMRDKYTIAQFSANYTHSHIGGDGKQYSSFCLGPFAADLLLRTKEKFRDVGSIQYLIELIREYVSWESLEGGPYRRMANIVRLPLGKTIYSDYEYKTSLITQDSRRRRRGNSLYMPQLFNPDYSTIIYKFIKHDDLSGLDFCVKDYGIEILPTIKNCIKLSQYDDLTIESATYFVNIQTKKFLMKSTSQGRNLETIIDLNGKQILAKEMITDFKQEPKKRSKEENFLIPVMGDTKFLMIIKVLTNIYNKILWEK